MDAGARALMHSAAAFIQTASLVDKSSLQDAIPSLRGMWAATQEEAHLKSRLCDLLEDHAIKYPIVVEGTIRDNPPADWPLKERV